MTTLDDTTDENGPFTGDYLRAAFDCIDDAIGALGMNVINIVGAPRACCICLESLAEWPIGAHNADPVAPADCCDTCNDTFVIPAREAHS